MYFTMIIGDFNAKLGRKQNKNELSAGKYGIGERNDRGNLIFTSYNFFRNVILCYKYFL